MGKNWLIVSGDFTRIGGMDRANYHLAWHLAEKRKHTVHLAALRVAEPLASHPNIRVHLAPRPFGRHILGEYMLGRLGYRLAHQLTVADPDACVVVNGGNCAWPDVNWVHMVHHACQGQDQGAPCLFRLRNRLIRWLSRRKEKQSLHGSRLILANSEKSRRDLIERLGIEQSRVSVVYLGVDPREFGHISAGERTEARARWQIKNGQLLLVFIGALGYDRNKGFDTLLQACSVLRDQVDFTPAVFAAGPGVLPFWQNQIDRRNLTGQVRLVGHVEDVAGLLGAADLLVSPTRYDAYGLAVHEALCRGVPAIVTESAGVAERFPPQLQELLLHDPGDAAELARRIQAWRVRRKEFAEGAGEFGAALREWTWDDMAAAMVERIETMPTPSVPVAVGLV